jgi:hypothetical protein
MPEMLRQHLAHALLTKKESDFAYPWLSMKVDTNVDGSAAYLCDGGICCGKSKRRCKMQ